jgi:hypothetical protein
MLRLILDELRTTETQKFGSTGEIPTILVFNRTITFFEAYEILNQEDDECLVGFPMKLSQLLKWKTHDLKACLFTIMLLVVTARKQSFDFFMETAVKILTNLHGRIQSNQDKSYAKQCQAMYDVIYELLTQASVLHRRLEGFEHLIELYRKAYFSGTRGMTIISKDGEVAFESIDPVTVFFPNPNPNPNPKPKNRLPAPGRLPPPARVHGNPESVVL